MGEPWIGRDDELTARRVTASASHLVEIIISLEERASFARWAQEEQIAIAQQSNPLIDSHLELMGQLLSQGIDIKARSRNKGTAPHIAANAGQEHVIWFLLDRRADPPRSCGFFGVRFIS